MECTYCEEPLEDCECEYDHGCVECAVNPCDCGHPESDCSLCFDCNHPE